MRLTGQDRIEQKKDIERINGIRKLLKYFKVEAYGFDPGILCFYRVDGLIVHEMHMRFDAAQWEWLEPLLKELQQYRKNESKIK
jgi:hypothetical protein